MEIRESKVFKAVQLAFSLIALVVIIILFFYAKSRIEGRLNLLQVKIPRNEAELKQVSSDIASGVIQSATEGGIKNVLGKSEVFFEESPIAAPARSIRDDAKKTIEDFIARLKALPAEELKVVKRKIYDSWFKTE